MDREPGGTAERPRVMRTRVASLAAVLAFALAVATVAVLAGRGDSGQDLIKLPFSAAGGAEDAAASTATRSALLAPGFGGGFEYKVAGTLPELASTAPAYRLGSTASEADVRRLAEALGLDGQVEEKDGAWVVTAAGQELRVDEAPGLPWYLGPACPEAPVILRAPDAPLDAAARFCAQGMAVASGSGWAPAPEPAAAVAEPVCEATPTGEVCPAGPPAVAVAPPAPPPNRTVGGCTPGTADCAAAVAPEAPPAPALPEPIAPPEPPARPAGFPTREAAERQAKALFERLGAGTDGFAMDDGWLTWEARVEPKVDGVRAFGLWHSVSIGPEGELERANGYLARPERIGDYPLVGVERGLERLRSGAGAGPRPLAVERGSAVEAAPVPFATTAPAPVDLEEAAKAAAGACADATVACAAPHPPADLPQVEPPVPPEPLVQTITGAHLALMQIEAVLVPVYVFELESGGSFPVPAVTEEWLQQQAPSVAATED